MAKIDDLAELLVEELSDFKVQLHRMEQLSEKLRTTPVSPDIKEMKSVLNINLKQQEELSTVQHKKISELTKRLSKSNHYPTWLLVLFGTLILFCFSLTSYSIYEIKDASKTNNEYYEKGQNEVINHFSTFLKENKEANDTYQKWSKTKTE
ncbi:hypothetical protein SAMN04488007_3486 [Maribacter aquivivus]|uniref:Uncharacterized protein n=1 Tax=Maribacter aquivivus TaxID=228958 RepID=A0A1M6U4W9_9FLAO|nr:DUF6730 family protein [Maribacter aquivivus]SHK64210.1 hypothetical protein SAMN04488007_3486 [Maribacter aquivivus]